MVREHTEVVIVRAMDCGNAWTLSGPGRFVFHIHNSGTVIESVALVLAPTGVAVATPQNLQPGQSAELRAVLKRGAGYEWHCETADGTSASTILYVASHHNPPRVVPSTLSATLLEQPLRSYTAHEDRLLKQLKPELEALQREIAGASLPGAERAWLDAHLLWLKLGQDDGAYGAFGALAERIDGTSAGLIGGSSSSSFSGFHRIELDLWHQHDLLRAGRDTRELVRLVGTLTPAVIHSDLPDNAFGLDAWTLRCHEILEDALRDSLTQDDNYGSDTDLASITADVTATQEMLSVLQPLLNVRSPGRVRRAETDLREVDAAIAQTRRDPRAGWQEPAALPTRERQHIDAAVDAALGTLAPVSELMELDTK